LPDSVYVFPLREKLVRMMESAGFVDATFEEWTGGVVALHTARRNFV
jgi:ubiquinone/menaquinone biosynthesis C-methylase UbiE